jgi:3-hydroxyacyl-[acyl-carrier-protein] dehydratase
VRFHLIDRVVSYEPGKSVHGRKLTSWSEEYWEDSPSGPTMPAPLLLEALCQAGTWLIIASTDRRKRAALLSVGSVDFLRDVHPGDILELEGVVDSMSDESAVLSGRVLVDDQPVLEAEQIMCVLIDVGDLEEPEITGRMLDMLARSSGASAGSSGASAPS